VPLGGSREDDELLVGELVSVGHGRGPVASDGTSRRHRPEPRIGSHPRGHDPGTHPPQAPPHMLASHGESSTKQSGANALSGFDLNKRPC
jgi:hypothetical protein